MFLLSLFLIKKSVSDKCTYQFNIKLREREGGADSGKLVIRATVNRFCLYVLPKLPDLPGWRFCKKSFMKEFRHLTPAQLRFFFAFIKLIAVVKVDLRTQRHEFKRMKWWLAA